MAPRPPPQTNALATQTPAQRLLANFLAGRSPHTVRAYEEDLRRFTAYVQAPDRLVATDLLLKAPHGKANEIVLGFKNHLLEQGYAPATVNRALSSVHSLVAMARVVGLVPWTLEVKGVPSKTYRDTRGPGKALINKMLDALPVEGSPKTLRDTAIVRLLFNQALRRGEVVELNCGHFNPEDGTLSILGKKRRERETIKLSGKAVAALAAWLEKHPTQNRNATTPLFVSLDNAHRGMRLRGDGVHFIITTWARGVGGVARPHGLRHTAITEALERSNGNVRAVQGLSRHTNPATVMHYDDNRKNLGKQMSDLLEDA